MKASILAIVLVLALSCPGNCYPWPLTVGAITVQIRAAAGDFIDNAGDLKR